MSLVKFALLKMGLFFVSGLVSMLIVLAIQSTQSINHLVVPYLFLGLPLFIVGLYSSVTRNKVAISESNILDRLGGLIAFRLFMPLELLGGAILLTLGVVKILN